MKRKTFRLSDQSIEIINRVMEEQGISVEVRALEHILSEYARQQGVVNDILDSIDDWYKSYFDRLVWATAAIEKNSYIMLDILNTMAIDQCLLHTAHVDYEKSPVVEQSENRYETMIAHRKQRKDNRIRRGKE